MVSELRRLRPYVLVLGGLLSLRADVLVAQQGPVGAMFSDDQKRGASIALSFATAELPATATAANPLQIFLTGGDLERAFDNARFRPDAAVVPTNTELEITAPLPGTDEHRGRLVRRGIASIDEWQTGRRNVSQARMFDCH